MKETDICIFESFLFCSHLVYSCDVIVSSVTSTVDGIYSMHMPINIRMHETTHMLQQTYEFSVYDELHNCHLFEEITFIYIYKCNMLSNVMAIV